MKKPKIILMRHGQSEWNKKNVFTGWVDIPLSSKGIQEALDVGLKLADQPIDVIFVSSLIRCHMTAFLAMSQHKGGKVPVFVHEEGTSLLRLSMIYDPKTEAGTIPVYASTALNERMYGQLQGLSKQETVEKFGAEQVKMWRRSYDTMPPGGESLSMTAGRAVPYFNEKILPLFREGKNVFVCAHGNSLRAIVMNVLGLTKEQILNFEIAPSELVILSEDNGRWIRE